MSSTNGTAPAIPVRIEVDEAGRIWAKCSGPGCVRTLGRILGEFLEVKEGRRLLCVPWIRDLRLPCPRCHAVNVNEDPGVLDEAIVASGRSERLVDPTLVG